MCLLVLKAGRITIYRVVPVYTSCQEMVGNCKVILVGVGYVYQPSFVVYQLISNVQRCNMFGQDHTG